MDRIGAWQGVVWPYVNTFGLYTTLYIPAGTRGATFAICQIGLKLVDWALARRFVKAHNRELRRKYRLGAAPVFQGSAQGALLSLAF